MKKIIFLVILVLFTIAFSPIAFAASGTLTVNPSTIYVNDSFNVTVNVFSAAAWNVHVASTGPVNNCQLNEADVTSDAQDIDKTFTISCQAQNEGTITITLTGDITSSVDDIPVPISSTKTVTVIKKQIQNNETTTTKKITTMPTATTLTTTTSVVSPTTKIVENINNNSNNNNNISSNPQTGTNAIIIVGITGILALICQLYYFNKTIKKSD